MKFIIGVIAVLIIGNSAWNFYLGTNSVTKDEFQDYRKEFSAEMDSLKCNQDTLKAGQDYMTEDIKGLSIKTDSVISGQKAIYTHITKRFENPKRNDGNYLDNIIKFLK